MCEKLMKPYLGLSQWELLVLVLSLGNKGHLCLYTLVKETKVGFSGGDEMKR